VRPCVGTENLIAIQKLYVTKIKIEAVAPQAHDWHKAAGCWKGKAEKSKIKLFYRYAYVWGVGILLEEPLNLIACSRKLLGEIISRGNFLLGSGRKVKSKRFVKLD
jgi:hypothetical protein